MQTASADVTLIDAQLTISALFLEGAREKYRVHPSAENQQKIARAVADIDRLLDERLARR